jgi:hypothetical protein
VSLIACASALLATGACSSSGGDDGADPCAGLEEREESGEATIGTGYEAYAELDDEIVIVGGPQGGFHLNLNARVLGLELGNSNDLLDPRNPSTVFGIFSADGRDRLDLDQCPVRVGYRPDGGDAGVLQRGVNVVFDVQGEDELTPLFDQPVLLRLDVVDADGRHTADERTVTVRAPR